MIKYFHAVYIANSFVAFTTYSSPFPCDSLASLVVDLSAQCKILLTIISIRTLLDVIMMLKVRPACACLI